MLSTIACLLIIVVAVLCWVVLRLRLAPPIACKVWFGCTFAAAVIVLWITMSLFQILLPIVCGVHKDRVWTWVMASLQPIFFTMLFMNPQIQIHADAEFYATINKAADLNTTSSILCLNHTSFFDSFVPFSVAPLRLLSRVRLIYKAELERIPLWGRLYVYSRSFPVYFNSSNKDGDFSVDRSKQDAVNTRMKGFLIDKQAEEYKGGSVLSIFPEGAINKGDPEVLQPLRYGTIKMALDLFSEDPNLDIPFTLVVQHGAWKSWPSKASMGGLPADVYVAARIVRLDRAKSVEENATMVGLEMQQMIDALKVRALGKKEKNN